MYKKIQSKKMILLIILMFIGFSTTVEAIGLSPLSLDIMVEKEKEIVKNIEITNPSETPIYITGAVTGSISQFITLEPEEFDLPAGPGMMNPGERPSKYVTVKLKMPENMYQNSYTGEIIFTQRPVGGGVLGTSAQLGVPVKLTIVDVTEKETPFYINILTLVLVFTLILALIISIHRIRSRKQNNLTTTAESQSI